jgi:hypothetical protein
LPCQHPGKQLHEAPLGSCGSRSRSDRNICFASDDCMRWRLLGRHHPGPGRDNPVLGSMSTKAINFFYFQPKRPVN